MASGRRTTAPFVELPVEYTGDFPAWPLAASTPREIELWEQLWRAPQAAMWVRQAVHFSLARYVHLLAMLEVVGDDRLSIASTNLYAEARLMEQALGIGPTAMKRLNWVVADEVQEKKQERQTGTRGRLRAVDPAIS
jgi:hypothetical protein